MKKKLDLSTIMSGIHLIFVLSIVCFGITYLTLGILALPALTSAFSAGREVFYGEYNVYDSVIKKFFAGMKKEMRMMRYFPLQLLIILQTAGMYAVGRVGINMLFVPMLICSSFILTLLVYIMAYHIFYSELPKITEVLIAMFYRLRYFLLIWVLMMLTAMYFGTVFAAVLFFAGAAAVFLLEGAAMLGILAFKRLKNELSDEDKKRFGEDILIRI